MLNLEFNYQRVIDRAEFCLKICGANLYNTNKYTKALLFIALLDTTLYYFVNISSVSRYSEFILKLYCFVTFGMGIQFQTIAFHIVYYRRTILEICQIGLNMYIKRPFFGKKLVHLVLKKYSLFSLKTSSILLIILVGSGICLNLYPIIYWLVTNELVLCFGFIIPYTYPEKSYTEYILNFLYQVSKINIAVFFLTGIQLYLALFILHACCHIDVIKALLTDIGNMSSDIQSNYNDQDIGKKLRYIIEYHQNYLHYLSMMDKVFRWQLFLALACIVFQMAVGLLIVTQMAWIPGYFTIIFGTVELFISCYFGTLIEIKNDELIDAIYATPWYLFNIPDRKLLLTFLMASQKPRELSFGQLLPMNLQTFLAVTKSIYTYLMMLMNFVE